MKSKQERIKKANKTYCDGHAQEGIKICRWENMPGWQKFLKGEITETQLSVEAKQELAELDQAFGKYLRSDSDREKIPRSRRRKTSPRERPGSPVRFTGRRVWIRARAYAFSRILRHGRSSCTAKSEKTNFTKKRAKKSSKAQPRNDSNN